MAPRKLSDSDKSEIVDLYKQPGQTTSTLAEQFGVSSSTVSRILKTSIQPDEYSELIAQKRMGSAADKTDAPKTKRRRKTTTAKPVETPKSAMPELESESPAAIDELETGKVAPPKLKSSKPQAETDDSEERKTPRRRKRRRSKGDEDAQLALLSDDESVTPAETETMENPGHPAAPVITGGLEDDDSREDISDDSDDDEDDLSGLDDSLDDDFGDDDELDEDEDDEDEDDAGIEMPKPKVQRESAVEIMPLDQAVLPKPCYLVVDMRAELITRPLSEFADLGQIPSSEEKAKTLPVFDNHRVARRFSRNKQRVIKVPDGGLITRTSPYLAAKGITRLLVDGQVFDLMD